jgi:hypothetical protein
VSEAARIVDVRQDARLVIGEGAVLTKTRAAEILGFDGAADWLEAEGLVSRIAATRKRKRRGVRVEEIAIVERVVWRRVLRRLEGDDAHAPIGADIPGSPQDPPQPVKKKRYRLASV